jgi:ribonuclease HI
VTTGRVLIFADGASRGNPGRAAIGAVLKDGEGNVICRISREIGIATNNQAEYRALIAALAEALRLGARQVDIRMDSELVVRQACGQYRVKNAGLRPLHEAAMKLLGCFQHFSITHMPGEDNHEAHHLAGLALRPAPGSGRG